MGQGLRFRVCDLVIEECHNTELNSTSLRGLRLYEQISQTLCFTYLCFGFWAGTSR